MITIWPQDERGRFLFRRKGAGLWSLGGGNAVYDETANKTMLRLLAEQLGPCGLSYAPLGWRQPAYDTRKFIWSFDFRVLIDARKAGNLEPGYDGLLWRKLTDMPPKGALCPLITDGMIAFREGLFAPYRPKLLA